MANFLSLSSCSNFTFVDVLREQAANCAHQTGYCFLQDGETQEVHLSYAALDQRAQSIAAMLQPFKAQGERALLLYLPGLEYIAAFFGCLYAGVIAVPAYLPRRNQNLSRVETIATDAQARFILTTKALLSEIQQRDLSSFAAVEHWIPTDSMDSGLAADWRSPSITAETLVLLQYTSGSTAQPKGVQITHANLLHNSALIYQKFEHSAESRGMIWLPPYHDMGLIGGILQPLYGGFPVTLMSPVAFLQKPIRWLKAISHYRGTTSGAPNFAYDLCIAKISAEQRAELDLSSWEVAFTGAEPIRADTLNRFAAAFAPCGFRSAAFYPCYGLAEATLFVSGGQKALAPKPLAVSVTDLQQHQVVVLDSTQIDSTETHATQTLISCGQGIDRLVIMNPETQARCKPNQVGEIWVAGRSVTQGYWQQPDTNSQTFHMFEGEHFLRTGDLGFLNQDELYITGRIKDTLIIRGRNYYPQDIERTVEQSHAALHSCSGAAFT
ncbi:MAG: fatty acyl-AMP ligase, partial [Cyanobacteria bacterium CRU_2_1]|nr:fatty acyl-AMP ligase [Cyanobacteria bacterium CRU_2_1]